MGMGGSALRLDMDRWASLDLNWSILGIFVRKFKQ